jgi:hypothetical protein
MKIIIFFNDSNILINISQIPEKVPRYFEVTMMQWTLFKCQQINKGKSTWQLFLLTSGLV